VATRSSASSARPPSRDVGRGFADPVRDAQAAFDHVMRAMAEPGTVRALSAVDGAPGEFAPALAAIALTLTDQDTPVWLDGGLRAAGAGEYLTFHTGAPITDRPQACRIAFAIDGSTLPQLSDFAIGSLDYPDMSATVVLAVDGLVQGRGFTLTGPGIDGRRRLEVAGLPTGFLDQWAANRDRFPRGVDIVLAAGSRIAALPRSVTITP
jgi:alpha-D-ribose 1-methylphosphonate 5-triphosphate synthase subunit PhnH